MENTVIPEDILKKAQKLLNLKEGAEAVNSHQEAANAASKLNSLLLKYNLSLEQVKTAGIEAKAGITEGEYSLDPFQNKHEADWAVKLFNVLANHNMCKVIHNVSYNGKDETVTIFGTKLNVQLVYYMGEQLASKIKIAEKLDWKRYDAYMDDLSPEKEKRNTFKRGYLLGAVIAIMEKLEQSKKEVVEEVAQEQSNTVNEVAKGFEIMLLSNAEQIQKYMQQQPRYQNLFTPKSHRQTSSEMGKRMGYSAGKKMEINSGLGNSSNNKSLN